MFCKWAKGEQTWINPWNSNKWRSPKAILSKKKLNCMYTPLKTYINALLLPAIDTLINPRLTRNSCLFSYIINISSKPYNMFYIIFKSFGLLIFWQILKKSLTVQFFCSILLFHWSKHLVIHAFKHHKSGLKGCLYKLSEKHMGWRLFKWDNYSIPFLKIILKKNIICLNNRPVELKE